MKICTYFKYLKPLGKKVQHAFRKALANFALKLRQSFERYSQSVSAFNAACRTFVNFGAGHNNFDICIRGFDVEP